MGINEIISQSGVAKATMYRHFRTKNDLVLAVLQRREQLWTFDLVERQSRLRGSTPEEQLLAIFDVFHDWFQKREDFDGCSFINVLIELGATHPRTGRHPIPGRRPLRSSPTRRNRRPARRRRLRPVVPHPDEGFHHRRRRRRPRGCAPRPGHGPHPHRTTPTTSRQLNRNRDVCTAEESPGTYLADGRVAPHVPAALMVWSNSTPCRPGRMRPLSRCARSFGPFGWAHHTYGHDARCRSSTGGRRVRFRL